MNTTGRKSSRLQQKSVVALTTHPLKCQYCSRHFYGNALAFKKHVKNHERRYHQYWRKTRHKNTELFHSCTSSDASNAKCVEGAANHIIQDSKIKKDKVFVYLVYPQNSLCMCNKENQKAVQMPCDCQFTYQRCVYKSIGQMHHNMSQGIRSYLCDQCKKQVIRTPLSSVDCNTQRGQVQNCVCTKCGDSFLNSLDLDVHCQACFGYTKSGKSLICPTCDKEYKTTSEICVHISSFHSGTANSTNEDHCVKQTLTHNKDKLASNNKVNSHFELHSVEVYREQHNTDQETGQTTHTSGNEENVEKDQSASQNQRRSRKQVQPIQYVDMPLNSGLKQINKRKIKQRAAIARPKKLLKARGNSRISKKVWPCKECTATVNSSRELKLHMKTHKSRIDKIGPTSSQSDSRLRTNTQLCDFECQLCGINFLTAKSLKRHKCTSCKMTNASSETKPEEPHPSQQLAKTQNKSKYLCDKCPQSFLSLRQMRSHMKAHRQGQAILSCAECSATFQTKSEFNMHAKTHKELKIEVMHKTPGLRGSINDGDKQTKPAESVQNLQKTTQRIPKYGCKKCDRVCLTIGELRQHRKVHKLRGDKLICEECHKTFGSLEELTQHVDAHKFPCRFCGIEISTPDNRKRHEMNICSKAIPSKVAALYQEKKKIGCKDCDSVFNNRAELRQHMKTHKYKCSYCNMEFTQEYTRNRHEKSKCGSKVTESVILDKKLECKLCGQMFENRIHWRQHAKTHKNERWACKPCDQNFRTRAEFLIHKKTHKGVWCKTCNVSFQTTSELDDHKKEHKFPCQFCGREFPTIRSCRQHTETACHNALMVKKLKPRKVRKDTGIHKNTEKCECYCDQCGKKFNNLRERNKHRGVHFKQKLSTPTKCPECDEVFEYGTQLRMHQKRVHWPEKPFACLYCKFRFRTKPELLQHEVTHTADKPHACPICNRRFKSKKYIQHHMYMHTGARPYQCRYCPKFFRQPTMLRLHERRHRGEKPYKCIFCHRSYTYGPSLRIHLNSHVRKGDITETEAQHADEVIKKEIQERAKVLREKHKNTTGNSSNSNISNTGKRPAKTGVQSQPGDQHTVSSQPRPLLHVISEKPEQIHRSFGQNPNAPVQLTIQPSDEPRPSEQVVSHFQRLQEAHTAGSLEAIRYFHNPPNWQPLPNHQGMPPPQPVQNPSQSWEIPGSSSMGIHCSVSSEHQPQPGSLSSAVTSALYGIVHRESEGREYQQ